MASSSSSTAWVIKAITSKLDPGRPRAFSSVAEYKRASRKPLLYCLRNPHLSDSGYAELAFSLFKKTEEFASDPQLADFEIVEALGASRALCKLPHMECLGVLDWCHVSFKIGASDSSPLLLCFAELVDFGLGDLLLLNSFSYADVNCPEKSHGCGFCPPTSSYPHPPSMAFTAGRCPIDIDKQEKLASAFRRQVVKKEDRKGTTYAMSRLCVLPWDASPRPEKPEFDPSLYTPMLRDKDYAAIALDHINEKEGKDYVLVRTFYANCEIMPGEEDGFELWCHVAFLTQLHGARDLLVRFFAEMKDEGQKKLLLNGYCTFDLDDPDLMEGCGICPKSSNLPHPSFKQFSYTVSRPRFSKKLRR